jgi:CrcB protein
MAYLWIAVGSALGGVLRHWCSGVAAQLIGETFPWGTLIVNVAGSFAIGFFFTYSGPDGRQLVDPVTRQFVMVGICGGYTTFSSFSLQTLNLMRDGQFLHAGANILCSVLLCMLAVWLGHLAAAQLSEMGSVSRAAIEGRHAASNVVDQGGGRPRLQRSEH